MDWNISVMEVQGGCWMTTECMTLSSHQPSIYRLAQFEMSTNCSMLLLILRVSKLLLGKRNVSNTCWKCPPTQDITSHPHWLTPNISKPIHHTINSKKQAVLSGPTHHLLFTFGVFSLPHKTQLL